MGVNHLADMTAAGFSFDKCPFLIVLVGRVGFAQRVGVRNSRGGL
jgi:hypothetical protein